jgi:hypothetical protein
MKQPEERTSSLLDSSVHMIRNMYNVQNRLPLYAHDICKKQQALAAITSDRMSV